MNDKFWMIFIEGRNGPTKQHFTFDDARLEAERLLRLPGNESRKAYVLGTCCIGERESLPIAWRHL